MKIDDTNLTAAERVRRALEAELSHGLLEPSSRLDEAALAERFGVSRTPVREALKSLAAQQLVELRPHAGAFVAAPSVQSLLEMFEAMGELEAACAGFAAQRARPADIAALSAAHEACLAAGAAQAHEQFLTANNRFHDAIGAAAGNAFLSGQTLALRRRLAPWRGRVTWRAGMMPASQIEHAAILEAIMEGDAALAAQRARAHLDTLGRDSLALMRDLRLAV